ncbi:MAG: hypothetical protein RMK49_10205 [Abditibacteriales bacterium]|nr:hypothetical protein [Abditibacteriales bacterium]
MKLKKADVVRFVQGHRAANAVTAQERIQRLSRLTVEEARREYDALCAIWYESGAPQPLGDPEERRKEFLVERRRRLDALARRGQR